MIIITKFKIKIYHLIEMCKIYQKYQKAMKIHTMKNHTMKNHLLKHFKINNKQMKIINLR